MAGIDRLFLAVIPLLLWYAYSRIKYFRYKQYEGLPHPESSLVWGHMKVIHDFMQKGDLRRHTDYVFGEIAQAIGSPEILILDLRPVNWVMCVIFSHQVAEQISRVSKLFPYSTPKSPTLDEFVPLIGAHSIIKAQGEEWKGLRKRYNAGFAPQHLITLLPRILEKTSIFLDNLDVLAKSGEEFAMDTLCVNLTFDIIGAVVMDLDLGAQLSEDRQRDFVRNFGDLVRAFSSRGEGSLAKITLHPRRKRLGHLVDQNIKKAIAEKFSELKKNDQPKRARSVLALSFQDTNELTPEILQQTADQVKSFLFAGHDTTSILLQWAFYELSRSPRVLATLRAELDRVFGEDADLQVVTDIFLSKGEEVIRQLTYTSAVVKEILRLYPPAGTARRAPPGSGFFVTLRDGRSVCLDGMVLYSMHYAIQRDRSVYGVTADDFMPERWLGDVDTSSVGNEGFNLEHKSGLQEKTGHTENDGKVPPAAWRPFERGPRNCIGQELANLEARVILACVVRRYDFVKVGIGELLLDESGSPTLNSKGQYEVKDELFNTRQITSRPVDGTLMRVKFHKNTPETSARA